MDTLKVEQEELVLPIYRCLTCNHQRAMTKPECPRDGSGCKIVDVAKVRRK